MNHADKIRAACDKIDASVSPGEDLTWRYVSMQLSTIRAALAEMDVDSGYADLRREYDEKCARLAALAPLVEAAKHYKAVHDGGSDDDWMDVQDLGEATRALCDAAREVGDETADCCGFAGSNRCCENYR